LSGNPAVRDKIVTSLSAVVLSHSLVVGALLRQILLRPLFLTKVSGRRASNIRRVIFG
jgi:hypothetical protein